MSLFILLALAILVDERPGTYTKQCVYDYLGNEYIITVRSSDLCPLSLEVDL